jgi:hypothetical protein
MLDVKVTVLQNGKEVPLAQARDPKVRTALGGVAKEVGAKLTPVLCPVHQKPVAKVRIVVGPGGADIAYDACCDKLKEAVGKVLG